MSVTLVKTFFNSDVVLQLNVNDFLNGDIDSHFYVIEVAKYFYLQKMISQNPISITPYFSTSLKFKTLEEANDFIKTLGKVNSKWRPKIREVINGVIHMKK